MRFELFDHRITVVALYFYHAVLDGTTCATSSGTPVIRVTHLPPRPLVSRCTRTTPSPAGREAFCLAQVQAATGCRQSGQIRPLSVE